MAIIILHFFKNFYIYKQLEFYKQQHKSQTKKTKLKHIHVLKYIRNGFFDLKTYTVKKVFLNIYNSANMWQKVK